MLNEASKQRKAAISELHYADSLCYLIPDLEEREHLRALIAGSIGAAQVKDPKAKLISVGLVLIGSLANNMYDKYCEFRSHLARASHHFEMANFYNFLSLQFNDWPYHDDAGTKYYLRAIDYLTLCDMLTSCIEDDWVRIAISDELNDQKDRFLKQLDSMPGQMSKKMSVQAWTLYENIYEIIAECDDEELKTEIPEYIYSMCQDIDLAGEAWGN